MNTLELENKHLKEENEKLSFIKASFTLTYILLITTSTITIIEALRTQNPMIRHIFNLETVISLIAGYFYSIFVSIIEKNQTKNKKIKTK